MLPSRLPSKRSSRRSVRLDQILCSRGWFPRRGTNVEQYANNLIEADHGQLPRRLRAMRGLQNDRTAQVVIAGHTFVENMRPGHYQLGVDASRTLRVAAAVTELARAI
jgi:IS6 family transposase